MPSQRPIAVAVLATCLITTLVVGSIVYWAVTTTEASRGPTSSPPIAVNPVTPEQFCEQRAVPIIEQFLDAIFPPEPIDYTAAAALLKPPLSERLRTSMSYIPSILGIQDSPSRTAVFGSIPMRAGNGCTVIVAGIYGLTEDGFAIDRVWEFTTDLSDTPSIDGIRILR